MERIRNSAKMLLMEDLPSVDELAAIVLETVRRNRFREDVYVRPSFYKSTRAIGVRLHHLDHELYVIATPFGNYIDIEKGVRVMTSSWRRNADEALPARGKIVGGYVNMAFQKSEAELNGFDEALVLTPDGHASEGSAANLFVVRDGVLLTPPVSDDILEGVTRKAIVQLAEDAGYPGRGPLDRPLRALRRATRSSCAGPASRSAPVVEVDHRAVGTGAIGPSARRSASATSRRCGAACTSTSTGSRPSALSGRAVRRDARRSRATAGVSRPGRSSGWARCAPASRSCPRSPSGRSRS